MSSEKIPETVIDQASALHFSEPLFINTVGERFRPTTNYIYSGGMIATRGSNVRMAHTWSEVQDLGCAEILYVTNEEDLGRVTTATITRFDAAFINGDKHHFFVNEPDVQTLRRDFLQGALDVRPVQKVNFQAAQKTRKHIQDTVAKAQLPTIQSDIDAGKTVTFGALQADQEGLILGRTRYAWDDFVRHDFDPRQPVRDGKASAKLETHYTLQRITDIKGKKELQAHQIHNLAALNLLIAAMRTRRGF